MKEFDRLIEILERLRGPGGCPWDAEQDHRSISRCMIEEAYELVDAIDGDDVQHLREELGDVLLQVVFHSTVAKEAGEFTIKEVIDGLCAKLIHRHPHVFGEVSVSSSKEVLRNWERLKKKEKGKAHRQSILDGIPQTLPSLLYARKIQSAVSRVGFDWQDASGVVEKIREEADELLQAMKSGSRELVEEEIGDLLFSIVNLARFNNTDPEAALRRTNRKFIRRFHEIEKYALRQGIRLEDMTLEEMDSIWERVKEKE